MNLDALYKTFPEASWLPYVVVLIVALTLLPGAINLYTNLVDRRSDTQLLEKAEKATAIYEKLPAGHKARSELLTYISHGPIADLSLRHTTRAKRKKEAKQRRRANACIAFSTLLPAIGILIIAPSFYDYALSSPPPSMPDADQTTIFIFATNILVLIFGALALPLVVVCLIAVKIHDLTATRVEKVRLWIIKKWHGRKGKGGVYQI